MMAQFYNNYLIHIEHKLRKLKYNEQIKLTLPLETERSLEAVFKRYVAKDGALKFKIVSFH